MEKRQCSLLFLAEKDPEDIVSPGTLHVSPGTSFHVVRRGCLAEEPGWRKELPGAPRMLSGGTWLAEGARKYLLVFRIRIFRFLIYLRKFQISNFVELQGMIMPH